MKKNYLCGLFGLLGWLVLNAQPPLPASSQQSTGHSHLGAFEIQFPLGVFARSQFAGFGLNYSWSPHRFGKNVKASRNLGFIVTGNADYYLGKKIKPAGYDFRYGGYLYFNMLAGVIINPSTNGHIAVAAGPGLGIYKGNADAGAGVRLWGNYFISNQIAIGPAVTFKKHAKTDGLWTAAVRIACIF